MPTVTLPDRWVLVMPCGCIDGVCLAVLGDEILAPTAEAAWVKFTPLRRNRERERREGWVCRGGTVLDARAATAPCPHVADSSVSGTEERR